MKTTVEIITIGDEILIGQIVDTNSAWMASRLNRAGFFVSRNTSIHDDEQQIITTLDAALAQNDIVLMTGGLGPTKDDITKNTLCRYFDTQLVFDESVYHHIQELFKHRPVMMNKLNQSQSMVPKSCEVIQNKVGTAPVMWFERNGKVIVSMPGVPYEMKMAMEEVVGKLSKKFIPSSHFHYTVQVYGYAESALALKIADWEKNLPDTLHLAYLPSYGIIRLRLSGNINSREKFDNEIAHQIHLLEAILGDSIVAHNELPVEYTLFELLKEKSQTFASAESCTGGNLSHRMTLIPGSSDCFNGGVVAYQNEVKRNVLNVSQESIQNNGAVSEEVVVQMARGVQSLLHSDWAIGISGIAGPTGGTPEKPVGTVWMAVAGKNNTIITKQYHFGNFPREVIIERTTTAAFLLIIQEIQNTNKHQ